MEYVFIIIVLGLALAVYLKAANSRKEDEHDNPELFSTQKFEHKDNIKSAKCPQCGKTANTYMDIKENFGHYM